MPSLPGAAPAAERNLVWVIWFTYGVFYFCRTNMAAAVPGLTASTSDGGAGLSAEEMGWILASLKLAYAIGQLVNGQLSEQFSPRKLLAIGMFGSAALNVLFGLSTGFYFLLFVWAANGYCQSLGWTPCVRVLANWVPVLRRGKAIGIVGTGYQVTLGLTFIVSTWSAATYGWRGALFVPSAILAAGGLFMLLFLRESPEERSRVDSDDATRSTNGKTGSFAANLVVTLTNPTIWLLGLALGLLNACRYGFLDWGIKHLATLHDTGVAKAGLKYAVIAPGAAAGSLLAGWMTDRFFGSRRAPVICILLVVLGTLTLVYDRVARAGGTGMLVMLFIIGFCIYGPQVLLVGTAPADLARRGTSAAAAGFVNFMGYLGASTGDVVTGKLLTDEPDSWRAVIFVWAGWAFAAAAVSAVLWRVTARKNE